MTEDQVCRNRGPRVGEDVLYCELPKNHSGRHKSDDDQWSDLSQGLADAAEAWGPRFSSSYEVWAEYSPAEHRGVTATKPSCVMLETTDREEAEQWIGVAAAAERQSRRMAHDLAQPHFDATYTLMERRVEYRPVEASPDPVDFSEHIKHMDRRLREIGVNTDALKAVFEAGRQYGLEEAAAGGGG